MSPDVKIEVSERDLGWLAGIVDGEGCFRSEKIWTNSFSPRFQLRSRYDDVEVEQNVKRILGCGKIYIARRESSKGNEAPQFVYDLSNLDFILKNAIPIFDLCRFKSKKSIEYPIWRKLAILAYEWHRKRNRPAEVVNKLEDLHWNLQSIKDGAIPVCEMYDYHWDALTKTTESINNPAPSTGGSVINGRRLSSDVLDMGVFKDKNNPVSEE